MIHLQTPAQMLLARRARRSAAGKQDGVTMIELTIVLVLAGLLAVAGFIAFQANSRRISVSNNTSQVTETAAELRKKFGATNTYSTVTTAIAVKSAAIPANLRDGTAATATNSYGGAITAVSGTIAVAGDSVDLTWPGIVPAECTDLIIGTADVARKITVAGTAVKPLDAATVDIAALTTACDAAAPVTAVFSIGR